MSKSAADYYSEYDKDYFGNKAGANSLLWIMNDGKERWYPHNGCHAMMGEWPAGKGKVAYSSLWCRYEELYEAALRYWGFILNDKTSPWREAMKDVEIVKNPDGRPIAFGIHDMNAPTQLAVSAMMQCRVPQEQASKLRSFWWWLRNDFTELESFYLSEFFLVHIDGKISYLEADYQHGFENKNMDMKVMKSGEPPLNGSTMGTKSNYSPVTKIWGFKDCKMEYRYPRYTYINGSPPLHEWLHGTPKYEGFFSTTFKKLMGSDTFDNGLVTKEEAVKILKARRSEWSCE